MGWFHHQLTDTFDGVPGVRWTDSWPLLRFLKVKTIHMELAPTLQAEIRQPGPPWEAVDGTLPETNILHLKISLWKRRLLENIIFWGELLVLGSVRSCWPLQRPVTLTPRSLTTSKSSSPIHFSGAKMFKIPGCNPIAKKGPMISWSPCLLTWNLKNPPLCKGGLELLVSGRCGSSVT